MRCLRMPGLEFYHKAILLPSGVGSRESGVGVGAGSRRSGAFRISDPRLPTSHPRLTAILPRDMTTLRTCVFPCAGFGTRFFPATKVIPKEMLPLVDKPILQYGIEEARASGLDKLIIVTSKGKASIFDHFDYTVELERSLRGRQKLDLLAEVETVSKMADLIAVRQKE